jgi:hypothetical protein
LPAAILFPSTATAAAREPEPLLRELAEHQAHGWQTVADGLTYPEMEAVIADGGRVYVPCGVVAILGQRLLTRNEIPSRLVGAFSNERGELYDVPLDTLESHAMLEVWEDDRWVLYDLDSNVKAVDENGEGVGIEPFARGPRYSKRLTDETEVYNPAASPYPLYETWLFANSDAWYDRVLGTLAIRPPGALEYYFTDPTLRETLGPLRGYEWVDAERWQEIVAAPPPPPRPHVTPPAPESPAPKPRPPAPRPVVPIPPLVPGVMATVPRAHRQRPCRMDGKRIHRRGIPCHRARAVLRTNSRRGKPPQGWHCSGGPRTRCRKGRLYVSARLGSSPSRHTRS